MHFMKSVFLNIKNMIYIHPRKGDTTLEKYKEDNKRKLTKSRYHNKVVRGPSDFKRKSMTHSLNGRIEILKSH